MRIFAVSDLHIDYEVNKKWLFGLSQTDFKDDVLILAGDVTHLLPPLIDAFSFLKTCFAEVLYVPGNHDLWVLKGEETSSLEKFARVLKLAAEHGIHTKPVTIGKYTFVPLFGWYDYSFGQPAQKLINGWSDFTACSWPEGFTEQELTRYFLSKNSTYQSTEGNTVITFSHFVPRIDVMPSFIPDSRKIVYPVLGTSELDLQIRQLNAEIHVYGHTHVNRQVAIDGVLYVNNAYGYPYEHRITRKELLCICEDC